MNASVKSSAFQLIPWRKHYESKLNAVRGGDVVSVEQASSGNLLMVNMSERFCRTTNGQRTFFFHSVINEVANAKSHSGTLFVIEKAYEEDLGQAGSDDWWRGCCLSLSRRNRLRHLNTCRYAEAVLGEKDNGKHVLVLADHINSSTDTNKLQSFMSRSTFSFRDKSSGQSGNLMYNSAVNFVYSPDIGDAK